MKESIEISEKTLNRIRDYVARESLAGRQTTVEAVVQQVLETLTQIKNAKTGVRP